MKRSLLPLLGCLLLALAAYAHAYHSSITEMRYDAGQRRIQMSIKVFTDDFEKALSKGQPKPVSLSQGGLPATLLAEDYVRRSISVKTAAGAPLPLQFVGMQQEGDTHWLYCKVLLPRTMAGIKLRNMLLLDVFGDQTNIVNLEAGGKKQSALFKSGSDEELLTW